jgi:hypothetical protein
MLTSALLAPSFASLLKTRLTNQNRDAPKNQNAVQSLSSLLRMH